MSDPQPPIILFLKPGESKCPRCWGVGSYPSNATMLDHPCEVCGGSGVVRAAA